MGRKNDRILTHPFNRKPKPPDTSWVPGASSSQEENIAYQSSEAIQMTPVGPSPSNDVPDAEPDIYFDEILPNYNTTVGLTANLATAPHAAAEEMTLKEEIVFVVSSLHNQAYQTPEERAAVQEMFDVCQDDEILTHMCAYGALQACHQSGLPADIQKQIRRQPWAERGRNALDKYNTLLSLDMQGVTGPVRELLQNLATKEQRLYLALAQQNMEACGSGNLASASPNTFYNHNPASPKRRPSARTPNRSPPAISFSPVGSPKSGFHSDEERSQKRARKGDQHDDGPATATRTPLPSAKGKQPYASPTQSSPNFIDLSSSSGSESPARSGPQHGRRPRSAESKQSSPHSRDATSSPGTRDDGYHSSGTSKPQKLPVHSKWLQSVVASNKMVPKGKHLHSFEKLKYANAFLFLGGHRELSSYKGLEAKLDHMIGVFRRHQTNEAAHFHVTSTRCDSDDDDVPPKGCCPDPKAAQMKPKKCFINFHADNLIFHGQGVPEYLAAFQTASFFYRCLSRALTKIIFQYCQENKILEDPLFYPAYIEEALITYVHEHPEIEEGAAVHLAKTLGIGPQQVERKLILLGAKQTNQYDQQKQISDAQIIGTKRDQNMHPPQIFAGENSFHKLSPQFTKTLTRWLIENKEKVTPQNRFPDNRTIDKLLKIGRDEHPHLKVDWNPNFTRQVIYRYCLRYQENHFQQFPLLPQPNTNPPPEDPESVPQG